MAVQLDIRPCWKWSCPWCDRVIRCPTTNSMCEVGYTQACLHMKEMHPEHRIEMSDWDQHVWEKDHWGRLTTCK